MGAASAAFLLALMGRYLDAEKQLAGVGAPAFEAIVRGEAQRAARWRDPQVAGELAAAAPLPFLGVYAGMAVALLQRDVALVERIKQDMARPPVAGRLRYSNGTVRDFATITDSDDAIGQMLEAYVGSGLLYFPFASLRRIDFLPAKSFVDLLVPRAQLVDAQGQTSTVFVPLMYAGSTVDKEPTIRAGRVTNWDYVGSARRAIGQRDFVLDGGMMVGMQRVTTIEFGTVAKA